MGSNFINCRVETTSINAMIVITLIMTKKKNILSVDTHILISDSVEMKLLS